MPEKKEWPIIGMTLEETAEVLRVDKRTVLKQIREAGLPARKIGVGWRIEHVAVRGWLASGKYQEGETAEEDAE